MVDSRIWVGTLFCTVALLLTGCTTDDTTSQIRKFLATDSGPEDVLPPGLEDLTSDPESSRFIGENAGVSYFVTKYIDPDSARPGFCLVLSKPPTGAVSGCAADAKATRMRVGGSTTGSAKVVVASDTIPDGWTKIGEFLIVNPAG